METTVAQHKAWGEKVASHLFKTFFYNGGNTWKGKCNVQVVTIALWIFNNGVTDCNWEMIVIVWEWIDRALRGCSPITIAYQKRQKSTINAEASSLAYCKPAEYSINDHKATLL